MFSEICAADAPLHGALEPFIPGISFALPLSQLFLTRHLMLGGKPASLLQRECVGGKVTEPCSRASEAAMRENSVGVVMCRSSNLKMYI